MQEIGEHMWNQCGKENFEKAVCLSIGLDLSALFTEK